MDATRQRWVPPPLLLHRARPAASQEVEAEAPPSAKAKKKRQRLSPDDGNIDINEHGGVGDIEASGSLNESRAEFPEEAEAQANQGGPPEEALEVADLKDLKAQFSLD